MNKLNTFTPAAHKATLEFKKKIIDLSAEKLKPIVSQIIELELQAQATEKVKLATHRLAACLDEAYPYHLTYERHLLTTEITAEHLQKWCKEWPQLSERSKKIMLQLIPIIRNENKREMKAMNELLERQQKNMESWSPEQLNIIETIKGQLGLPGHDWLKGQKYTYKGHVYTCIGTGKMKCTKSGEWVEGVIYQTKNGLVRVMAVNEFATKYKPVDA